MVSISYISFKEKHLLVNVNREGHINAAFVTYGKSGEYIWFADADITKLQLDNFPYILKYLQNTGFSLELSFMDNIINEARIVSMQRDGGYKEPFHRVIQYSCNGYECLNNLESILSVQLNHKNEKMIVLGKHY